VIHYATTVTIRRPASDVYAALLDADLYPQWTPMVDTRFDADGPLRVGTRGSFRLPSGPLEGRYEMELVALEPDRRVDIRVDGAALRWLSTSTLEPDGDRTRLSYAGEIALRGWRRLLEPLFAREVRTAEAREAERLRDLLESGPGQRAVSAAHGGTTAP
jgi:uncharacterized protein YndB with AHSA1/START domain